MFRRPLAAVFLAAATLACVALAPTSRAESNETDAITVGALAESAVAVVVATVTDSGTKPEDDTVVWTFRVEESIRGSTKGAVLRVRVPAGRTPVAKGGRFLAFLRPGLDGSWAPLALPWALRTTAEEGTAPLVDYTRAYAACLGADARVARREVLAELLVASLASDASGVPFSAGRDLVRHAAELREIVTEEQRALVAAALARPRKADQDLVSIVLAAGAFGGPATDDLLVARLLEPEMRPERRHVVGALAARASADVVAKLAARVKDADAPQRADLANALGRLDRPESEAPLLALLGDKEPAVRVEAAHGLGLLARAVRETKAGEDPSAPKPRLAGALAPLLAAVAAAKTENERRAATWAVGQIDVPEAWDALRKLAKESTDDRVREIAKRVLAKPRNSLLLE